MRFRISSLAEGQLALRFLVLITTDNACGWHKKARRRRGIPCLSEQAAEWGV